MGVSIPQADTKNAEVEDCFFFSPRTIKVQDTIPLTESFSFIILVSSSDARAMKSGASKLNIGLQDASGRGTP